MYTIYEKPDCPFCVKAKELLKERGKEHETVNAVARKKELINLVVESGNPLPRTVPQIFHDGKYIGGYQELTQYFEK